MNLITHALTTLTAALTLVISSQSFASKEPSSYSVAQIKNQQSTPELLTRLKSNVSNKQSSLILQKTQNLTREQHQKQKHSMSKSNHDNAFSSLSGEIMHHIKCINITLVSTKCLGIAGIWGK